MSKSIIWTGNSLDRVKRFPDAVKSAVGAELRRVQNGLEPTDYKPMTTVGAGVKEIRIHVDGEHRVLYVAKFAESVYVLHAFKKKTQKTEVVDLDIATRYYRFIANQVKTAVKRKDTK
jgi:phage-related protein